MANIDVVDLGGKKVGSFELAEEIFCTSEVLEAVLWEAPGHACDEESQAGLRLGQEAVEAEGHWPRPCGLGALAAVAAWRHGARTAAALL